MKEVSAVTGDPKQATTLRSRKPFPCRRFPTSCVDAWSVRFDDLAKADFAASDFVFSRCVLDYLETSSAFSNGSLWGG